MNRDSRVPVNLKVGLGQQVGLNLVPASAVGYFDSAKSPLRRDTTLRNGDRIREFIIYAVNIVSRSLILPEFG